MNCAPELRASWRPLLAATIGMGSGMSVVGPITTAIVPSLLADAGWTQADFAMISSLSLLMAFVFPLIGRLTDSIGVRATALTGQVALPLVYLAYSMVAGQLWLYAAIFAVQSVTCVTTTATVYTRLAVQYSERARGLALAIVASGPGLTGLVIAPVLNTYVEAHGWQAAYRVVAVWTASAGLITFLLTPDSKAGSNPIKPPKEPGARRAARDDYALILRKPAFWILGAAMLLCNLPQTILLAQLKLLLLAKGISGTGAAVMLGAAPLGMLAGRLLTGLALDRYNASIVSFAGLALPSLGLFTLASHLDAPAVLAAAVLCLGFAFGSEADILAYLVARHFKIETYSAVLGLLTSVSAVSIAAGALLLSFILTRTGGYNLYLIIVSILVLVGAGAVLLLGRDTRPDLRRQTVD